MHLTSRKSLMGLDSLKHEKLSLLMFSIPDTTEIMQNYIFVFKTIIPDCKMQYPIKWEGVI